MKFEGSLLDYSQIRRLIRNLINLKITVMITSPIVRAAT